MRDAIDGESANGVAGAEMEVPEVTVAMPAYNAGAFIRQAIESILSQEGITLELVVVDDHSTDDTAAVAEAIDDRRVVVLRNTRRRGIGACHNLIVQRSRAPYIAHVDADDFLLPGALRKLVDAVTTDPKVGQSHCYFFDVDAGGHASRDTFANRWRFFRRARPPAMDHRAELPFRSVANALRTFRRTVLEELGPFDERLPFGVDYDMALRLVERHRITLVPEFLYARRVHRHNTTEGLRFRTWRLWWIKYLIRSRLVGDGRVTFIRDPALGLGGFLRDRWKEQRSRWRIAGGRVARVVFWQVWAPRAPRLHRVGRRWCRHWPLSWWEPRRPVAGAAPHIVYYARLFPALSETFIQREVAALQARGIPVEVIAEQAYGADHFDDDARRMAAQTIYAGAAPGGLSRALRTFLVRRPLTVLNLFLYVVFRNPNPRKSFARDRMCWRRALQLALLLRERGATHVHTPWATGDALVALLAARLAGTKFSVQARASDLHRHALQPDLDERLGHAEFVITNAHYNVSAIRARLGDRAPAIHTIYEGVDPRAFTCQPRARDTDDPLILSVTRLVEPKGVEVLLRACRILKDRGIGFRCEIVGGRAAAETNYYIELRKLQRALDLEHEVRLPGAVSFAEVREKYAEATIYALAAVPAADGRRDVTPNTVIEAMAMGLPVVSSLSGAIPELIEDGVSGVLVAPRDEQALATAIADLLADEERCRTLGAAARRRVEERFDITKNIARYIELFVPSPVA